MLQKHVTGVSKTPSHTANMITSLSTELSSSLLGFDVNKLQRDAVLCC